MENNNKQLNLPKREEEILKFWEENRIFEKSLEKTKRGRPFVFYEGPPTANGKPGVHHAEARVFKDIILRYKTMRGFHVPRKAGWDTHGLPVEIEVERALGLKTKQDIERYGVAKFNQKAKESVWRYKDEWEKFTKRLGFWLDLEHPYITYETPYIETLWRIIKEFWKKNLLYEDFKVLPWCPRCQTGLSSHEVGLGYKKVEDTTVYVKFRLKKGQKIGNFVTDDRTYILSWTTTPWTLPGNVGLAVRSDIDYVLIKYEEVGTEMPVRKEKGRVTEKSFIIPGTYVLAKDVFVRNMIEDAGLMELRILLGQKGIDLLGDIRTYRIYDVENGDWEGFAGKYGIATVKGHMLVGLGYEPLFDVPDLRESETAYKIYPADFVSAKEGTGVVHTAVMYGEDDYRLGGEVGLPRIHTLDEGGRFVMPDILAGRSIATREDKQKTEGYIIGILGDRVFKQKLYPHEYPHCWRCDTPLLYYARKAWWVKTTAVKKELLANNEKINWIPAHLKHGRFGEFLREVRDWAFSRERYWGTPLPVWRCEKCAYQKVIGSREELMEQAALSKNRYLLLRHGRADSNVRKFISSDPATEAGKSNLLPLAREALARAARKLSQKYQIDLIIASDFARTKQTAEIIRSAAGAKVVLDSRLREMNHGIYEGKPVAEYQRVFKDILERFTQKVPGGESLEEVRSRMFALVRELETRHQGKTVLLVSHGDPLWILEATMRGLNWDAALELLERNYLEPGEYHEVPLLLLPRDEGGDVNLHRPYVDNFMISCSRCTGVLKRVSGVVDGWFDSGSMPFASQQEKVRFPADYISEAVDQTRGWFYSLLVVATLLGRGAPYKNVISLGHVLDKYGQKMSKSKGNVVDPMELMAHYGADAVRWYFYTINSPGDPKWFDEKDLQGKLRGFLMTFWNSFVFFDTYVDKIVPRQARELKFLLSERSRGHTLDQWILLKLDGFVTAVTEKLDSYDITSAARVIENFVINDFSQWYLRRSRRRFQRPESKKEKDEATATTARVLLTLCRLTAPFTPFLSEAIYQELRKKMNLTELSVHLAEWPSKVGPDPTNPTNMFKDMEAVRKIVAEALRLRAEAGIKVRQPLARLEIKNQKSKIKNKELLDLIREEVNVKEITFGKELKLDTALTPELKEEGIAREIIRNIQEMRRDDGLKPRDKIRVQFSGTSDLDAIIDKWRKMIAAQTGIEELTVGGKRKFRIEREIEIGNGKLRIALW